MKLFAFILLGMIAFISSGCRTKKAAESSHCFKGRLEIKAACMNYTISVLEGNMDTSLIVANWMDESTSKTYKNVFELGNKCNFPSELNQGDEFYFVIDSSTHPECAVCMLYYPVPPKALSIRVVQEACKQ